MTRKLSDFRLASQSEIENALKPPKDLMAYSIGGGLFTGSPGWIHITVIFKVMHETFDPHNSHPGEKSTWEWILFTQDGLSAVHDHKGGWSIGYIVVNRKSSCTWWYN